MCVGAWLQNGLLVNIVGPSLGRFVEVDREEQQWMDCEKRSFRTHARVGISQVEWAIKVLF
jgi:hypothetical protein